LIIAVLLEQFVERRTLRADGLELQLKAESGEELGELRVAQLASAAVFQSLKRGAADTGFACELNLAKVLLFSVLGDLLPYRM
jgi:hypothetical protein